MTRVGFMGILLATVRRIKWRGKDPSCEVLMVDFKVEFCFCHLLDV